MKKNIIFFLLLTFSVFSIFAQNKQTYERNGTNYVIGETYTTTGQPKVERSSSAKNEFLKSKGYSKVPYGYEVDHIIPLSQGGRDTPDNMQLITIEQHKVKTAKERANISTKSSNTVPTYKSNSTYNNCNYNTPSYNSNTSSKKTVYTGSRGGQYYINSNGNKTYIKKQ